MFENDRIVFYVQGDIDKAGQVLDLLAAQGVQARGPAQDVWTMSKDADSAITSKLAYSNDSALGQAGKLPKEVKYDLKTYSAEAFMDWYLKLCSFVGKSPVEPYRTSFVYAVEPTDGSDQAAFKQQAEKEAGYPVVLTKKFRKMA